MIKYMNTSPITTATAIKWTQSSRKLVADLDTTKQEIESVFFNLPKVRSLNVEFSDSLPRYLVEGISEQGVTYQVVMYIKRKQIYPTYIQVIN